MRTDLAIKSSAGNPQHLLECLAVELCADRSRNVEMRLGHLFNTQGLNGILRCRASGGDVAGNRRDGQHQHRRPTNRQRIRGRHAEQEALKDPRAAQHGDQSDGHPDRRYHETTADHQTKNVGPGGAQGHAHADLATVLRHDCG